MFKSFKQLFDQYIPTERADDEISEEQLQIAAVALLVEMMHIDDQILDREKEKINSIVRQGFSLDPVQADELIGKAENALQEATDYFQFTSRINKGFNHEQKVRLVKYLWQVAFIDGQLDVQEDYMVRKVADLLYVSHAELIQWRNRVRGDDS